MLVWDVTIRNTFAASYTALSGTVGGVSAKAERDKLQHYEPLMQEYLVKPFVIETSGVWGREAAELIKKIGKRIERITGDKRPISFIVQRIALEVQRGNARMALANLPGRAVLTKFTTCNVSN